MKPNLDGIAQSRSRQNLKSDYYSSKNQKEYSDQIVVLD